MQSAPKPWRPLTHNGARYDLDHLAPFAMTYEVPAKGDKPSRSYTVDVTFGTHCFTEELPKAGGHDRKLEYRDAREVRLFSFRRHKLSKALPDIVKTMLGRKCASAERMNYFTIAETDEDGSLVEYDVLFVISKSSLKGRINLFIQSAYVGAKLPKNPVPIRFEILLYNTLHNRRVP